MVSNSAKRDADNSGNHVDLRPLKNSAIAWSNGSTLLKFLLITQLEVPLINTSEETKKVKLPNGREQQMYKIARNAGVFSACHPHFITICS